LDAPPAPEGYTYRWIRAETLGVEDHKNLTARLSEGFDLVRAEELDDSQQDRYDTLKQGRHAGVVARGGLLLAKIPNETREERNSYYNSRAKTQQDAVDNDMMKESDPSSPMLNPQRSSKVTFGGGQRS
jgi:hypothetical protein